MIKKGEISRRLYERLLEGNRELKVEDVRVGLGYTAVKLEGQRLGLAAVLRHELKAGCSTRDNAGTLTTYTASRLLHYLVTGDNALDRAVGLAAANAIIRQEAWAEEKDALELMGLSAEDHVAMVGFFPPLVEKVRKTGAALSIIERDSTRAEVVDGTTKDKILKGCTVAIITATTIINNTLEEIINGLGEPRHVAILGPSTPLCPEVFEGTPVTHLGGAAILDIENILKVVSEGGGTPSMRPYVQFVNILLHEQ